MLTEQQIAEIRAERAHYEEAEAAIPAALRLVQNAHGWVSDEHRDQIAEALGLTPADVDMVGTFYSLIYRRPVGRHVILLCDSVSCWIVGYEPLRDYMQERLGIGFGETTADGRFTLLPVACLGACDMAPVMMVDEDLHGNLTAERIEEVLEQYV